MNRNISNKSDNNWWVGICIGIIGGIVAGIKVEQGAWIRKGIKL